MTVSQRATLLRRCRLVDAARGVWDEQPQQQVVKTKRAHAALPAFCLASHHFGGGSDSSNTTSASCTNHLLSSSPKQFHSSLCDLIRNAKQRVSIASLYIGPAASPNYTHEAELLQALSHVSNNEKSKNVHVQIVLDHNRALRPVPITTATDEVDDKGGDNAATTTSSAQAVANAIRQLQQPQLQEPDTPSNNNTTTLQKTNRLHLCQVLPSPLDAWLPNPLNEIAGVFHIKAYIVDDDLILSGANLSEEYFVDRQDRYLWITKGGNGLVDFYAELIDLLCQYSTTYDECDHGDDKDSSKPTSPHHRPPALSQAQFLQQIAELFSDPRPKPAERLFSENPETVAICVPTFHHPQGPSASISSTNDYGRGAMINDVDATLALLEAGVSENDNDNDNGSENPHVVQLSSAYLNPTDGLLSALSKYPQVDFLTAGRQSHGFRPKPSNKGNKGNDWVIPTVFDHLAYQASYSEASASTGHGPKTAHGSLPRVYHWERPDWTFHAKGLWIHEKKVFESGSDNDDQENGTMSLAAAVVGSSNFGGRSVFRDMESNVFLIFPPQSSKLSKAMQTECRQLFWNKQNSKQVDPKAVLDSAPPLPFYVRKLLPWVKNFF